jgi:uncharacterized protein
MAADSHQSEFAARFDELRKLLACPACQGVLRLESDKLVCAGCGRAYPIVDGIPVLIPQS